MTHDDRRLQTLTCLHPRTKEVLLARLSKGASPEQVRAWREENLAFLERWIAPVAEPRFRTLCLSLNQHKDWGALRQALGLPDSSQEGDWLNHAFTLQMATSECLWCLAQFFALPGSRDGGDDESWGRILLGKSLGFLQQPDEAVAVLEDFVGLSASDYAEATRLGQRLRDFVTQRQLTGNNAASLVRTLADRLGFVSRPQDAVRVLEGFVGLSASDYAEATRLGQRLRDFVTQRQLTGNNAASLVRTLADRLGGVSRPQDAVRVLEGFVGLSASDYAEATRLGQRLRDFVTQRQLEGNNAASLVRTLADRLGGVSRPQDAVRVLEGFVGLSASDYAEATRLGQRLRDFVTQRQLPGNNAASLVGTLADRLGFVSRPQDAVRVLEGFVGLSASDYAEATRLGQRLRDFVTQRQLTGNNAASLVLTLADRLGGVSRPQDAVRVLEGFTNGFALLEEEPCPLMPNNVAKLIQVRMRLGFGESEQGAGLFDRFLAWLRRQLLAVSADNKAQMMNNIARLRQTAVAFADQQAQCCRLAQDVERWRRRGLLWDSWLGQRVLLERMLFGRPVLAGSEGPRLIEDSPWPFPREARPTWSGGRPERRTWTGANNALLDTLSTSALPGSGDTREATLPGPLPRATTREPWQVLAWQRLNAKTFGEPELAADLGTKTLLLRAGFGSKGQLHWTAWLSDGSSVRLVAHESRPGQPGDRRRLRWAQWRHDLRMALAYGVTTQQRAALAELLAQTSFQGLDGDALNQRWQTLIFTVQARMGPETAVRVLRILRQALGSAYQESEKSATVLAEEWPQLIDAVRRAAPLDTIDGINAATAELLREAEAIWDLSALQGRLGLDLDLVLLADDVLHGVPFAHLRVGEQPLFAQVRSTRASLSPLLDAIQKEIEKTAPREDEPRVAGAAWFGAKDPARPAAVEWLHGLANVAEEMGHRRVLAAEQPQASGEWLQHQLHRYGPARVFGWCGHGHEAEAGIVTGPSPGVVCQGEGMRLELYELLLIVSCSLGRQQRTGAIDLEGFCCNLTLNGMRSAFAARWPIHAQQAADVANTIARHYLLLRCELPEGGTTLTQARIRALALNRARQELLADGPTYANTLAAFELWGLA